MQSDLEAVFELVDSVRADQDSRIHTLAAEIEKMRALVEQSLGHSIDLMRSEISSTLSEMHRTTEIGQSELRTDLQRARRETTLKFEQLRQEVRAQRDEFKQDLLPLQSLVTGTATPEARRPKDRKNVEAKLKEDIASAQKKEEAAAIDSRLETAVASVRAEMAQQLNQHFLVVDNRIVTELAALALKVQASLHEMDKKWERAIATPFHNATGHEDRGAAAA